MTTTDLISIITAVAATIGAFATWNAARQARESAKIARESMESASEMARKNLDETTRYNRRSAFENRYGLLLGQHNLYHNQLCEYIDKQKSEASQKSNTPIVHFFEHDYTSGSMGPSLSFLTGHQIISRYMRTLYHLLKFIKNEFYIDGDDGDDGISRQMKNYVSPVRSTIRNDILCLIAVNALNIENKKTESVGYVNYQKLLHFFDFFEHAVFHSPFSPNKVYEDENTPSRIYELIMKQSSYDSWFNNEVSSVYPFKLRSIQLFSPVIACMLIYQNPMKSATKVAVDTIFNSITKKLSPKIKTILTECDDLLVIINDYKNGEHKKSPISERVQTTNELFEEIEVCLKSGNSSQYNKYAFYAKENSSSIDNPISGHILMGYMDYKNFYKTFCDEINTSGGVESFLGDKKDLYLAQLPAFYKQLNAYSSEQ